MAGPCQSVGGITTAQSVLTQGKIPEMGRKNILKDCNVVDNPMLLLLQQFLQRRFSFEPQENCLNTSIWKLGEKNMLVELACQMSKQREE